MKMRIATILMCVFFFGFSFNRNAVAAHFVVDGNTNGNFSISGSVLFWDEHTHSSTVIFTPDFNDVDQPADAGTPITVTPNVYTSTYGQYPCDIVMNGSVVNGVASINSMSVSGANSVCSKINFYLASQGHFPWRLHTISPSSYQAMLKGIYFYSPALFSCSGVTAMVNINGGYASFDQLAGPGGCHMSTWGNAAVVSPAVDVVL